MAIETKDPIEDIESTEATETEAESVQAEASAPEAKDPLLSEIPAEELTEDAPSPETVEAPADADISPAEPAAEDAAPDAAPSEPALQEDASAPLDASATDAFPAFDETTDEGGATAPVDGATDDAGEAGADDSLAEAPAPVDAGEADPEGVAAPEAPESSDSDTGPAPQGEPGLGATHAGTDTPEYLVSNPADPVTGLPLNQDDTGMVRPPITGGGVVPPASPQGAYIPGLSGEGDEGNGGGISAPVIADAPSHEDGGHVSSEQHEAIMERLAHIEEGVESIKASLSTLLD